MAIKVKAHENLSDANIKKVIELLEAEKPITKKEACEILNISNNSARLAKIIEKYKSDLEETARRKAANRGKPASSFEIQLAVENYLDGDSIADIAKRLYRSAAFVRDIIDNVGVPYTSSTGSYWLPDLIPEQCAREEFFAGEIVWNSKRNSMSIVRQEQKASDPNNKYYQVYVLESIDEHEGHRMEGYGGYYDGAYAYDLAALDHLKKYGVDVSRKYKPYFKNWLGQ